MKVWDGIEKIIDLYNTLHTDILAPYSHKEYPFRPHITLGYFRNHTNVPRASSGLKFRSKLLDIDQKLYDTAYQEAIQLKFNISTTLDSIAIIEGDENSQVKILKKLYL